MGAEGLSEREQQVLEHLNQAQSLGVSIKEYAEAYSLEVKDLYNGKAQLVRKGVWPGKVDSPSGFIPVQIGPSTAPSVGGCRMTHPSGWTIECATLPDAEWVARLLKPGSEA